MEPIKASSSQNTVEDVHRTLETELEAAEALAELAHVAAVRESISEQVMADSTAGNSCFGSIESLSKRSIKVDEVPVDFHQKDSTKTCIWSAKTVTNEQTTELRSNASYAPKYASSCSRKSRRMLTEAEKEARKIRRVLANRESARQTIRRRQAIYEELARKAGDLAWENKKLKKKKEMASKELESLKRTNECFKAQMITIMKVKVGEIQEDTCSSSSNSPIMMYNPSSFFPFTWPSLVLLPHPWHFSFLQNNNNQYHPSSFNLNEKPIDSFPSSNLSTSGQNSNPGVRSAKPVCDVAATGEARKRKQHKTKKDIC
ncbi:hypothetical protein L2E82_04336 [Cichorium intybus]|uniref:Uncharacterized protein n=1 Tax=Cichorium intybus TaxID=13427 RepID=A0ACB9H6W6_CICIN|nr:hypothetical protein L2E82_04336 [Cichorium intybus]